MLILMWMWVCMFRLGVDADGNVGDLGVDIDVYVDVDMYVDVGVDVGVDVSVGVRVYVGVVGVRVYVDAEFSGC